MKISRLTWIITTLIILLAGFFLVRFLNNQPNKVYNKGMLLTSPVFTNERAIPKQYTCDGGDMNPELKISAVPEQAKSLVLIMNDPDAPAGTWTHWLVWNLPPDTETIAEGASDAKKLPAGAVEGTTSFGKVGWGGPCPHDGEHRYYFKLFALDTMLDLPESTTEQELTQAINGHILDQAELMGRYQRM